MIMQEVGLEMWVSGGVEAESRRGTLDFGPAVLKRGGWEMKKVGKLVLRGAG